MAIHLHDQRHPVKIPVNKLVPATRKHRGGDERHGAVTVRTQKRPPVTHRNHAAPANTSKNHAVRAADGLASAKCVLGWLGA